MVYTKFQIDLKLRVQFLIYNLEDNINNLILSLIHFQKTLLHIYNNQ